MNESCHKGYIALVKRIRREDMDFSPTHVSYSRFSSDVRHYFHTFQKVDSRLSKDGVVRVDMTSRATMDTLRVTPATDVNSSNSSSSNGRHGSRSASPARSQGHSQGQSPTALTAPPFAKQHASSSSTTKKSVDSALTGSSVSSNSSPATSSNNSGQQTRGRRKSPVGGRRSEGTPASSSSGRGSNHGSQEEGMGGSGPDGSDTPADMEAIVASSTPVQQTYQANGSSTGEQLLVHQASAGQTLGASCEEVDGSGAHHSTPQLGRAVANLRHVQNKITKTIDLIKEEQRRRDDNVNEYLKLAAHVDRQQLPQVKAVFEKKNQKSAQTIAQLQKKLERYSKQAGDLENQASHQHHHQQVVTVSGQAGQLHPHSAARHGSKGMLRDVGHGLRSVGGNIRDGISGLSGSVMSKPREFAHLIKNKFGSADNINNLTKSCENVSAEEERSHHGSATLPPHVGGQQSVLPSQMVTGGSGTGSGGGKADSDEGSECSSSVTNDSNPAQGHGVTSPRHPIQQTCSTYTMEPVWTELREQRDDSDRLKEELEHLKQQFQQELSFLNQALQEERFRCERLEEQMNDLTELHQNEMENLKQGVVDMEEKLQYQHEERLRDMHDMLESCQTKISRMEQQQQQQQQYVTLEGLENSQARALAVKLINVLLTMLQVVLLLVATGAGIVMPFLKTRARILTTIIFIALLVFVFKQWPDLQDLGSHIIQHYKQVLQGN